MRLRSQVSKKLAENRMHGPGGVGLSMDLRPWVWPWVSRPPFGRGSFSFEWNDLRSLAGAPAQRLYQACGAAVLPQQIAEGLIGKLLERLHALGCEQPELLPGFFVKLNAFSNHGTGPQAHVGERATSELCIGLDEAPKRRIATSKGGRATKSLVVPMKNISFR
jgi:hypothetical protein